MSFTTGKTIAVVYEKNSGFVINSSPRPQADLKAQEVLHITYNLRARTQKFREDMYNRCLCLRLSCLVRWRALLRFWSEIPLFPGTLSNIHQIHSGDVEGYIQYQQDIPSANRPLSSLHLFLSHWLRSVTPHVLLVAFQCWSWHNSGKRRTLVSSLYFDTVQTLVLRMEDDCLSSWSSCSLSSFRAELPFSWTHNCMALTFLG